VPQGFSLAGYAGVKLPLDDIPAVVEFILSN